MKLRSANNARSAVGVAGVFEFNEAFRLSVGGGKIDLSGSGAGSIVEVSQFVHQLAGLADASLGLSGAGFRSAAKPLDFAVHQVFERFLAQRLGMEKLFFLFEEFAVRAVNTQRAIGISAVEFHHVGGDILEKIAVVTDDDAGE